MKTAKEPTVHGGGELVLQEMWRIKDELSAARGHDIHRLFAEARERQKHSGRSVVNMKGGACKTTMSAVLFRELCGQSLPH